MTEQEYRLKQSKIYYQEHREEILQKQRDPEFREKKRQYNKAYREKNREKFNAYMKEYQRKERSGETK